MIIGGDGQLKRVDRGLLQEGGVAAKSTSRAGSPMMTSGTEPNHPLVLPSYTEGLPNIMLEAMAIRGARDGRSDTEML